MVSVVLIAACARTQQISEADRTALSCLAAKNVIDITSLVRDGISAGETAEALRVKQDDIVAAGLIQAKALFPKQSMHHTYFEYDVARRLKAVQAGLNSADEQSEDVQLMIDTFERGESCEVMTKLS